MFKVVNKVIKIFVVSDFFLNCAWGLLSPVFAIFLVQNITVGNIAEGARVAGFSSLFYWVIKSILQIPIGRHLDKNHGEKDDFVCMVFGLFISGLVPFGYLVSSQPWHIYLFQVFYAIGMALAIPPWMAIFTRHIDKGKEAFEWGMESTAIGFGAGIAGAVGGIMASFFGFKILFIFVGGFSFIATALLLLIRKELSPKNIRTPYPTFKEPFGYEEPGIG